MKRCPKCDFLYLDSDESCDLDGTLLVAADQSGETSPGHAPRRRPGKAGKPLSILGVGVVALAAIAFLVHQRMTQQAQNSNSNESAKLSVAQPQIPPATPSVEVSPTASVELSASPIAKASPTVKATPARGGLSSNPVSTSSDDGVTRGVIIRLIDGRSLPADEAWRTKDGIWYRRNGIVTLLKRSQVKAIEKAP